MNTEQANTTHVKPSSPPPAARSDTSFPASGETHAAHLWILWIIVVLVIAGIGALVAYRIHTSQTTTKGRGNLGDVPIPVDVAKVEKGSLPVFVPDALLGTVTPLATVTIHTRVDGQLEKVAFVQGGFVKKGDLLVKIDPRPFQAQLDQQQGQLKRDQASLENAQKDLKRYKEAPDAYTPQQVDTQQSLVDQDQGIVDSDQGLVLNAKVQLDYCTIVSPVTGRIGLRLVDEGNIVHASDTTGLAVITQLQPISVIFPMSQLYIPDVITKSADVPPLEVTAEDNQDGHFIATGKLTATDSAVDPASASVKLRADFDNTHFEFFPSELLKIKLLINTLHGVLLVPTAAVQTGPDFPFVYVVKEGKTVEVQQVTVGHSEEVNGEDLTEITQGLSAGDIVVTNGVDKLQDHSKVEYTLGATTRSSATTRGGGSTRPSEHRHRTLTGAGPQTQPPSDGSQRDGSQRDGSQRGGE